MEQVQKPAVRIAGNTSTSLLKLIALVFMFCDHAGKMLLPNMPEMRLLGRIAFPLYAWCIAVGANYTHCMPKYILRILLVGLISQPLYNIALNHTWAQPNIFLTLALGLAGIWGMKLNRFGSQIILPVLAIIAAVILKADYGWKGVLLILMLYGVRNTRYGIAAVMISFCLYWGSSSSVVTSFFGLPLQKWITYSTVTSTLLSPWLRLQAMAVLSLPLMLWHCPWRFRMPSWVGYLLYPAHLIVLWGLEHHFG